MLKKALYVYFSGYHPRNYKKLLNSFWVMWSITYCLLIMPGLNYEEVVFASVENALMYYSLIIPIIFMLAGNVLVPLILQKQMFLCPMTEQERAKYILSLMMIKIVVPVIPVLLLAMLQLLFFHRNLLWMLHILFSYISLTVMLAMSQGAGSVRADWKSAFWKSKGLAGAVLGGNVVLTIFNIIGISSEILEHKELSLGAGIYLAVSVLVEVILAGWLCYRNIPVITADAMDYERSCEVSSNITAAYERDRKTT